jgi:hypothetical protein
MDTEEAERRKRAEGRAAWPVRRFALGTEPGDDLSGVTSAEERLAMMWELARSAWLLTGRPLPDYDRRSAPGRVIRPGR